MFTIELACFARACWPDHACSGQPQTAQHGEPNMYRIITGLQACTVSDTAADRPPARRSCCGTCDRARIEAQLLSLNADDRSLRFSAGVVTDDSIRACVARIRFGHDVVLPGQPTRSAVQPGARLRVRQPRAAAHRSSLQRGCRLAWRRPGQGTDGRPVPAGLRPRLRSGGLGRPLRPAQLAHAAHLRKRRPDAEARGRRAACPIAGCCRTAPPQAPRPVGWPPAASPACPTAHPKQNGEPTCKS